MSKDLIVDLRSSKFDEDKYGYIEALCAQSFYARTADGGVIFFNQEDVAEVFRCKDFRFAFNLIDETSSPYLTNPIRHELLNMHGTQHQRLSRLVKMALRDRIIEDMRTKITDIVADLVSKFSKKGEIEFCEAFADPLPARLAGRAA